MSQILPYETGSTVPFVLTTDNPLDPGTRGSSGIVHVGKAVELAALDVLRQVLEFAAARLGSKPEDIDLDSWNVRYRNELLPLQQLILDHFGGSGYEFIGKGFINVPLDPDAPLGAKTACWMPNWVGAEVEVDPDTGKIHVLGLVVAVDAGRAINMPACRGQIEGGAIQAYGQALFEDLKYDGDRLINGTALTYKVPLTVDLPDVLEAIVLEQGMGPGPFDAKPIGESGVLGIASAIANAVEDAVGVRIADLPLTPERVLDAIDESGCRTSSS